MKHIGLQNRIGGDSIESALFGPAEDALIDKSKNSE
jgi:hypothetical protein